VLLVFRWIIVAAAVSAAEIVSAISTAIFASTISIAACFILVVISVVHESVVAVSVVSRANSSVIVSDKVANSAIRIAIIVLCVKVVSVVLALMHAPSLVGGVDWIIVVSALTVRQIPAAVAAIVAILPVRVSAVVMSTVIPGTLQSVGPPSPDIRGSTVLVRWVLSACGSSSE
jgi:hypothetical protein